MQAVQHVKRQALYVRLRSQLNVGAKQEVNGLVSEREGESPF